MRCHIKILLLTALCICISSSSFAANPACLSLLTKKTIKYKEPPEKTLVEEINQTLLSRYGGEFDPQSEVCKKVQEVFSHVARAAGVDPKKYTVHVLATKYVSNAFASPGNNIWITRAMLEGNVYQRVHVVDYSSSYDRDEPRNGPWSGSPEAVPLILAHELGHLIHGDLAQRLKGYRKQRRESITGESRHSADWTNFYDYFLPGGRSYRQEVQADQFAVKTAEAAGFSTTEILGLILQSDQSISSSHPADGKRAMQMGAHSSRNQNERTQLLEEIAKHSTYSALESTPVKKSHKEVIFNSAWEALWKIPDIYVRALRSKDGRQIALLQEQFQQTLLEILQTNPSLGDLKVLLKKLVRLSYRQEQSEGLIASSLNQGRAEQPPLNTETKYTTKLEKELKKITQSSELQFSNYSTVEPTLGKSIERGYFNLYDQGQISFSQYLESTLELSVSIYSKKDSVSALLGRAKTPKDIAEGYLFITRLKRRHWLSDQSIELERLSDATARWMKAGYVQDSMYEEIQRGLYAGAHFRTLQEKKAFSDPQDIRKVVQEYVQLMALDVSPLYRSAEAWPTGDIVGLLNLFPGYGQKPEELKQILDEEGKSYFTGRPKAKFNTIKKPFASTFTSAFDEILHPGYNDKLDETKFVKLGLNAIQGNEDLLRSVEYADKELTQKYFEARSGSQAEAEALDQLLEGLDKIRKNAPQSLRDSFLLERHFMGMHQIKTFKKRVTLLKAILQGASPQDKQRTFIETGNLLKKYDLKDQFIYGDDAKFLEDFGNPYASYDNHYAAAIGWVYDSAKTREDFELILTDFDLKKAPLLQWQVEMSGHFSMREDPFASAQSLEAGVKLMDRFFAKENPYRWIVFDRLWARFSYRLGKVSLEEVTQTALPDLNYYKKKTTRENAALNIMMLNELFHRLNPRKLEDQISKYGGYDLKRFFLKVQSMEREIYESALEEGLLSSDPLTKMWQVEEIFKVSVGSEASHPVLDSVRLDYLRSIDKKSLDYTKVREKLTNASAKAEAALPFLYEALTQEQEASHDRKRDLIRQHLPSGRARDRLLDGYLAKATALTKLEIERYSTLYSSHPKSELEKKAAIEVKKFDDLRRLSPEEKFQLVQFYLTRGNRDYLEDRVDERHQDLFLEVGNYLFEQHPDDQAAFLTELFSGDKSLFNSEPYANSLVDLVLLGGEADLPAKDQSVLTAIFESLYYSLDVWDRAQLLSDLIVESRSLKRIAEFTPPPHTPARAVRVLRLFKGFGPKVAQILRSHRAILGDSVIAQQYRDAFATFEEKAQKVELQDSIAVIEKSFGRPFDEIFISIDGVLGSGSIKKVLLGTLRDGTLVAIKYIDQDFAKRIGHSLTILRSAIDRLEKRRNQFPNLPILESIFTAIESDIRKELDLAKEHRVYEALRAAIEKRTELTGVSPRVAIPLTHEKLGLPPTDGNVIVEQAFQVVSVDHVEELRKAKIDRATAVRLHLEEQIQELLLDHFFDYDSRPANWTPIPTKNGLKLGYFDKAQGIFLTKDEAQGLRDLLLGFQFKDKSLFEKGFRAFERRITLPKDLDKAISKAFSQTNPYAILQELIFSIEKQGCPMSQSYSLKLSMWMRQIDRHLQMSPDFNLGQEIGRVLAIDRQP